MSIRQPIVCVLGHIDHGKTTLLDKIRGTAVQLREAGGITQHIGASFFPLETLKEICRPLMEKYKFEIELPGLLVVDTPGHEAFTNLRKRGGSVADFAILVVDVMKGFQEQTYECIDILKSRKTPFLVAANKIDLIPGWRSREGACFMDVIKDQDPEVVEDLDERIYIMVGELSKLGFDSDRYDRITDFTRKVAIVPTSAKTGEGVPDLLAVLIGLIQQYLKGRLLTTKGPAKGSILEVVEEVGLGTTINAIIYDGILRKGDTIVVGGIEGPIVTKVRAVLMPRPLDEIRDPEERFLSVKKVVAAAGVKIVAPNLDKALAGAPLIVVRSKRQLQEALKEVEAEIAKVRISTDKLGVVLKCDTLGSLEAITQLLQKEGVSIRVADVGDVCKRDVIEASTVKEESPIDGVILAFNVDVLPDAEELARNKGVRIFRHDIIYRLLKDYLDWRKEESTRKVEEELAKTILPGKIQFLPGYVFRRSKPAIFGVKVLGGRIRPGYPLLRERDGVIVGRIMQIQKEGKPLKEATRGDEVAISMAEPMVGRQVKEGEILYVAVPEDHVRKLLTDLRQYITDEDVEVLKELIKIMRRERPYWGM